MRVSYWSGQWNNGQLPLFTSCASGRLVICESLKPRSQSKPNPVPERRQNQPARGKLWVFRLLALSSPILLLALLEIFLRAVGYGYPTGFFLQQQLGGQEVLTDNPQFGWRFFPPAMARTPLPVQLSPHKPLDTVRIVILGESAAMGDPAPAFGVARVLEAMLELKFPGHRFEVINAAMTAINSHVVREIARDCAPLQADVWIVYLGNNEVVGPFGAGTVFGGQAPPLAVVRAVVWLKKFRVVQWLNSWGDRPSVDWTGMEMFLKQQVPRDDPRLPRVYRNFRENLADIVAIGNKAGAKVILSTVAVNLKDSPPFASQSSTTHDPAANAQFETAFARGVALAGARDFTAALKQFSELQQSAVVRKEATPARLYFQLARCELALKSNDLARAHFNLAKEYDTLRFRADDEINEAIRAQAAAQPSEVTLLDAARLIAEQSANGIPGEEEFYEHVHFNFGGNYLLARALFAEVVQTLPPSVTQSARTEFPSLHECARRLGWTDWHRREVYAEVRKRLQQPPFSSQFGQVDRDHRWQERIEQLDARLTPEHYQQVVAESRAAVQAATNDWMLHENFARLLEANNATAPAMEQWREVIRLLPQAPRAYYHLGNLLDATDRSAEALTCFEEALHRNPSLPEARNGRALALANLGRFTEAQRELETLVRAQPHFTEARVNLGHVLVQQQKLDEGIAQYEQALKLDTNSAAAHVNLGRVLAQRGNKVGAVAHYQAALRINPQLAVAHFNLGNVLLPTDAPAAAAQYAEAVRVQPGFGEAHLRLALALAKQGMVTEALPHFAEAAHLRPESADAHFNYGVALARAGQTGEAARQFSETLRLEPDNSKARELLEKIRRQPAKPAGQTSPGSR